jgi:RNA polymerase sigma-70 factor (ECF subfamily)
MSGIGQGGTASDDGRVGHLILQDLLDDLPRLKTLARAFARNDSDAHDLVQATCVRVLERANRLRRDDRQDSQALFVRIMKNLHVDTVRKRRVSAPVADDHLTAPPWSSIPLWRQVSDEALTSAASSLSGLYREIWTLSHERQLDQREIASLLRLRPGTVATRVHRARLDVRARLRELMTHEGVDY